MSTPKRRNPKPPGPALKGSENHPSETLATRSAASDPQAANLQGRFALRLDTSTILAVVAILISLGTWLHSSRQWDVVNCERLTLEESKFMPMLTIPGEDGMKVPYQGIPAPAYLSMGEGKDSGPRVELFTYFNFWRTSTGERLTPHGFFIYLDAAKKEQLRLAAELKIAPEEIEIRHSMRVATRFKNAGTLPLYSLRLYSVEYLKGDEWVKPFSDSLCEKFAYLRDVVNAGEEFWINGELPSAELDVSFPSSVFRVWIAEYKTVSGGTRKAMFSKLYEKDPLDGNPSWKSVTDAHRAKITNSARLMSEQNISNRQAVQQFLKR